MVHDEQREPVREHDALNAAADWDAAGRLLTDDFVIPIPPFQPFAGTYRGKHAFQAR